MTPASEAHDESAVLRQAFCHCVESIACWLGQGDGAPIVPDLAMADLKIQVGKQLLHHAAVPSLALDLTFQRAIRRFRVASRGVPAAALDQGDIVTHFVANALAEAKQKLYPRSYELERQQKQLAEGPFALGPL